MTGRPLCVPCAAEVAKWRKARMFPGGDNPVLQDSRTPYSELVRRWRALQAQQEGLIRDRCERAHV